MWMVEIENPAPSLVQTPVGRNSAPPKYHAFPLTKRYGKKETVAMTILSYNKMKYEKETINSNGEKNKRKENA